MGLGDDFANLGGVSIVLEDVISTNLDFPSIEGEDLVPVQPFVEGFTFEGGQGFQLVIRIDSIGINSDGGRTGFS